MKQDRGQSPDRGALDGVVVADFTRVLAGPLCTMTLADLGAEVIKVERPGTGDDTRSWGPPWMGEESTYSLAVNRNKRSVQLDLSDSGDLAYAHALARRADVVVENFRPGRAASFGLDYESLRETNPGLVYASITGFGEDDQASAMGGYDFLVQAMSGLMSITGDSDGEPRKVGVALVDVICGLYSAIGVLAALRERDASGRGQKVHVSLLGAALAALSNQASAYLCAGVVPERLGNGHPSIAPYETLRAADRALAVAVGSDSLFCQLVSALGLEELSQDPRFQTNADRVANREQLVHELESVLCSEPAHVWLDKLRPLGIPVGLVNDIAEAFTEAESLGLAPVAMTRRPDGVEVPTVRSPIELSRTPVEVRMAPPRLGEHDGEIRSWLEGDAS